MRDSPGARSFMGFPIGIPVARMLRVMARGTGKAPPAPEISRKAKSCISLGTALPVGAAARWKAMQRKVGT